MMFSVRFAVVVFVVCSVSIAVTSFQIRSGNSQYWRRMCDNMEEITDNSTCKYGVFRNACGKVSCLKGVKEACDDSRATFRNGNCAHGLMCRCETCQGCLGGECYSNVDCPYKYQYAKRMASYPVVEYSSNYNEY